MFASTPLAHAIESGSAAVNKLLLEKGEKVNYNYMLTVTEKRYGELMNPLRFQG